MRRCENGKNPERAARIDPRQEMVFARFRGYEKQARGSRCAGAEGPDRQAADRSPSWLARPQSLASARAKLLSVPMPWAGSMMPKIPPA